MGLALSQYSSFYNFCGIHTALIVPTLDDYEHFNFYYGPHKIDSNHIDIWIRLEVDSEDCSFIDALRKRNHVKRVYFSYDNNNYELYEEFIVRACKESIIPPVNFGKSKDQFSLLHASAVTNHKKTIMFLGDSFSGKSVFTLFLSQLHYLFLTDDMCVVQRDNGLIYPNSRPIGIRSKTLDYLPWLKNLSAHQYRIISSEPNFQMVVSPYTLPINYSNTPSRLTNIIILTQTDESIISSIERAPFPSELIEQGLSSDGVTTQQLFFSFSNIRSAFAKLENI